MKWDDWGSNPNWAPESRPSRTCRNSAPNSAACCSKRAECNVQHSSRIVVMANRETPAHQNLKYLASLWARQTGYSAVATEVQLPKSAFRADVAAYRRARLSLKAECAIGDTAVF